MFVSMVTIDVLPSDFLAKVMEDEAKKIDSRYKAEQQKKGAQNNTNKNKDNAKGKTITNVCDRWYDDGLSL